MALPHIKSQFSNGFARPLNSAPARRSPAAHQVAKPRQKKAKDSDSVFIVAAVSSVMSVGGVGWLSLVRLAVMDCLYGVVIVVRPSGGKR